MSRKLISWFYTSKILPEWLNLKMGLLTIINENNRKFFFRFHFQNLQVLLSLNCSRYSIESSGEPHAAPAGSKALVSQWGADGQQWTAGGPLQADHSFPQSLFHTVYTARATRLPRLDVKGLQSTSNSQESSPVTEQDMMFVTTTVLPCTYYISK